MFFLAFLCFCLLFYYFSWHALFFCSFSPLVLLSSHASGILIGSELVVYRKGVLEDTHGSKGLNGFGNDVKMAGFLGG